MAKHPGKVRGSGSQAGAAGAGQKPPSSAGSDGGFKAHKKRADAAWQNRALWQKLYDDAYEFAIPNRRPASRMGKAASTVNRLFDNTAIVSTFRRAGQLHQDLFPSGQQSIRLAPGPVGKLALNKAEADQIEFQRKLNEVTQVISAFMMVPEFDCAVSEMCLDLMVGSGALMPLRGTPSRPIRFVALPFDEVATQTDAYGATTFISWKTKLTRRQITGAFPQGMFPDEFKKQYETDPDKEITIWQDFFANPDGVGWNFWAHIEGSEAPIIKETMRSQPIATPRYYRVPGEENGRGPVLLALPTIKTLNKAMELTLKAAAIQMLGIWGYRPGSAFNPDTVRISPGQFWPMGATGGVLGADVTRIDTAGGRIDVSQLITGELRAQVQAALQDDNLPENNAATPRSATEIVERMKRTATNYLGAFGRLVNEIHPVIVRRMIEILYDMKLLQVDIDIDTLLVKVEVLSPIAAALRSQALQVITDYFEIIAAVRGEEGLDLLVKVDDALRHIGAEMGVPPEFIMTEDEQEVLQK